MTPKEWAEAIVSDDQFGTDQEADALRTAIEAAITDSVAEAVAAVKDGHEVEMEETAKMAAAMFCTCRARAAAIVEAGGPQAHLHEQIMALKCD